MSHRLEIKYSDMAGMINRLPLTPKNPFTLRNAALYFLVPILSLLLSVAAVSLFKRGASGSDVAAAGVGARIGGGGEAVMGGEGRGVIWDSANGLSSGDVMGVDIGKIYEERGGGNRNEGIGGVEGGGEETEGSRVLVQELRDEPSGGQWQGFEAGEAEGRGSEGGEIEDRGGDEGIRERGRERGGGEEGGGEKSV